MSILHLNRETGQVSAKPGPLELAAGRPHPRRNPASRDLLQSPGRFEVVDRIESAELLDRPGHTCEASPPPCSPPRGPAPTFDASARTGPKHLVSHLGKSVDG
jgi:hypothetical protein